MANLLNMTTWVVCLEDLEEMPLCAEQKLLLGLNGSLASNQADYRAIRKDGHVHFEPQRLSPTHMWRFGNGLA